MLIIAALLVIYACFSVFRYRQTSYYKITKNSFFLTRLNYGRNGEYLTYKKLQSYEKQGAKFLFNCYLPKDDKTTEIDILMLHSSGIYVIESKNYSGWIFGNEKHKTWTQVLPRGRGRSSKEHFLNPIMQNKMHIKWLKSFLADEKFPIFSIIVFSERCTLKQVDIFSPDSQVIKRHDVAHTISQIDRNSVAKLSSDDIEQIYKMLYPFTQVSATTKKEHIETIQNRDNLSSDVPPAEDNESLNQEAGMLCPRCGSALVERVASHGRHAGKKFYGCSAYPKCQFIKNID